MAKKNQSTDNSWMFMNTVLVVIAVLLLLSLIVQGATMVLLIQGGGSDSQQQAAPAPAPTAPAPGAAPSPGEPVQVSIEGRPIKGAQDAPVTVVEFSDFECGFCQRLYQDALPQIQSNYIDNGDVRFVYRHFQLFGDRSLPPMVASECAFQIGGNDAFWSVHDAIFDTPSPRSNDQLRGFAQATGIDMAAWDACFASGQGSAEVRAIIDADVSEGRAAGVSGTPTVFVNGNRIVGAQPFSVFQAAIEAEI